MQHSINRAMDVSKCAQFEREKLKLVKVTWFSGLWQALCTYWPCKLEAVDNPHTHMCSAAHTVVCDKSVTFYLARAA